MSDYTVAMDGILAGLAEVQRLGAVLASQGSTAVGGGYFSALNAPADRRGAELAKIKAGMAEIDRLAAKYAADCRTALSGPLAAALAATQEIPMTTRTIELDFSPSDGDRHYEVNDFHQGDTLRLVFTAPDDDPKFQIGVDHARSAPQCQRRFTLRDDAGKTILDDKASSLSLRMRTTTPGARGADTLLRGGAEYVLTVTQTDQNPARRVKRADCLVTVSP